MGVHEQSGALRGRGEAVHAAMLGRQVSVVAHACAHHLAHNALLRPASSCCCRLSSQEKKGSGIWGYISGGQ